MTEILLESLSIVVNATGFWLNAGWIIAFGMIIGGKLNEGGNGLKRSLTIILPFVVVLLSTNLFRVFDYTSVHGYGGQSFTNTLSIIIIAALYVLGLFIGHVFLEVVLRPHRQEMEKLEKQKQEILNKIL